MDESGLRHVGETVGRRLVHVSETSGSRSLEAGGLAAHSLAAHNGCVAGGQRERQRFWEPTHPTRSTGKREEEAEELFSSRPWLHSQRVLTCWDFRTPCVMAHLRRDISASPISMVGVRASLTLCVLPLRAISARSI